MKKISQKSLQAKVLRFVKKQALISAGDRVIVAVSGGADSVCLLFLLLNLREALGISEITVCHYNHRLRAEDSDHDAAFVKKLSERLALPLITAEAPASNLFKSEEEARVARYDFFEKILKEGRGDKLATAHNANDMAETYILRLIRGAGLNGLRGIPSCRGKIIRPLLPLTRAEIESYLKELKQEYVVDKTNIDIRYARNYIRIKVLPLLAEINPNIVSTLNETASLVEAEVSFIEACTETALKKVLIKESQNQIILDRTEWLSLPCAIRLTSLRSAFLRLVPLTDITIKQLNEVCDVIEKGEGNKYKLLPHSLRVSLSSGKIIISEKK